MRSVLGGLVCAIAAASCAGARSEAVAPVPDGRRVRVELHQLDGGYAKHAEFAKAAAQKLEEALNSPAFQRAVVNGRYWYRGGRSPAQILGDILGAREESGPGGADGVVDLRLRTISTPPDEAIWMKRCEPGSSTGTIGLDGAGSGVVATCPQHLDDWAAKQDHASLAGHMMHEYMHLLGYGHRGPGKYRSAVYRIGELADEAVRGALR